MREPDLLRLPVYYDRHASVRLAWDPTGTRLAVAAQHRLIVLNMRDPDEVRELGAPRAEVRSLAWSPDGDALAVAYEDRDLQQLLRAADGAELWRSTVGETAIDDVAWSPDGRQLSYVGDAIVVCAAETGAVQWRREERRTRQLSGGDLRVDGDRLRVIERVRFAEELIPASEARWSKDAGLLMARWGDAFRVLDARDGAVKAEGRVSQGVLRWTSCGDAVFQGGDSRLALCASRIADPWARTLTFSPDGRLVAAEGEGHRLWIQDADGARAVLGHPRTITAMDWSANGALATACRDGLVRGLSSSGGELEVWVRLDVQERGLAWSPDGARLAACCTNSVVVLTKSRP